MRRQSGAAFIMEKAHFDRLIVIASGSIENLQAESKPSLKETLIKVVAEYSANIFVRSLETLLKSQSASRSKTLKTQIQTLIGAIDAGETDRPILLASRILALIYIMEAEKFDFSLEINQELSSKISLIFLGTISFDIVNSQIYAYFHHLLIRIPNELEDSLSTELLGKTEEATRKMRESLNDAKSFNDEWHDQIESAKDLSDHYAQIIEKHKIGLSIEALAASYEVFRKSKATESKYTLATLAILALTTIIIPVSLIFHNAEILSLPSKIDIERFILSGIPFIGVELLLIFFARTTYNHFKSVEAQILQIDVKIASAKFIKEFTKFKSESKSDFSKFESLIFSGIVANHEKTPHAFEGLSDLANLIKATQKSKD